MDFLFYFFLEKESSRKTKKRDGASCTLWTWTLVQLDPSFLFFYLSFFLFSFNSLLPFFFEKKKIVTFSLWLFNSYPAALVLHFLSFIISSLVQWLPCCFENSYLFIYCFWKSGIGSALVLFIYLFCVFLWWYIHIQDS